MDEKEFQKISDELEKRMLIDPGILIDAAQYYDELADEGLPAPFVLNNVLAEILIQMNSLELPLYEEWLASTKNKKH